VLPYLTRTAFWIGCPVQEGLPDNSIHLKSKDTPAECYRGGNDSIVRRSIDCGKIAAEALAIPGNHNHRPILVFRGLFCQFELYRRRCLRADRRRRSLLA
jgi:hypothetical protein